MTSDNAGKGVLLKSDCIAGAFRDELKAAIAQNPRPPKLVGILATAAAPSKFYADFTKKQCDDLGVEFVLKTTGSAADSTLGDGDGVEEAIIDANNDDTVDGIMVGIILDVDRLLTVPTYHVLSMKGVLPYFRSAAGL
jgi:methylenetetrahydrofolate dehydrogenase (NAD+)